MTEPGYAPCDQMPKRIDEDRAAVAAVRALDVVVDKLAESLHELVNHRLEPVMRPADPSAGSISTDDQKEPRTSPLTDMVRRLIGRIGALDMTIRGANDRLEV